MEMAQLTLGTVSSKKSTGAIFLYFQKQSKQWSKKIYLLVQTRENWKGDSKHLW